MALGPTLTSPSAATVTGKASAPCEPMSRTRTAVAIDETLGQALMQRVRELRLDFARTFAHFTGSASQSARCAM